MLLVYEIEIVGGGYDGAPGMAWRDDGKHPPPDVIYVGLCRGGTDCGSTACVRGKEHVSFWTAEEEARPPDAQSYAKQEEYVERTEERGLLGRVVYAIGGLLDPRSFTARELVPAGEDPRMTARGAGAC